MEILKLGSDQSVEPAPEATPVDYALTLAKAAAIAFPYSAAGVALVDLITAPIRGKRFSTWCEQMRLRLNDLSRKVEGLTPETLAQDEAFFSTFSRATQAALNTHHDEKLEALRNAVLNVSVGKAPSEDKQSMFLNWIERFSVLHLRILGFAEDTERYSGKWTKVGPGTIPIHQYIAIGLPDVATEFQLVNAVVSELGSLGLIGVSSAAGPIPTFSRWITNLGEEFLRFIREPVVVPDARNP